MGTAIRQELAALENMVPLHLDDSYQAIGQIGRLDALLLKEISSKEMEDTKAKISQLLLRIDKIFAKQVDDAMHFLEQAKYTQVETPSSHA